MRKSLMSRDLKKKKNPEDRSKSFGTFKKKTKESLNDRQNQMDANSDSQIQKSDIVQKVCFTASKHNKAHSEMSPSERSASRDSNISKSTECFDEILLKRECNLESQIADSKPWHPIEHRLYKWFKNENFSNKCILVMVSGGRDSMTLLQFFQRFRSIFKWDIYALHVHHGSKIENKDLGKYSSEEIEKQIDFRDKAANFVQRYCLNHGVPCQVIQSPNYLFSEEDCRNFRRQKVGALIEGHVFYETFGLVRCGHLESELSGNTAEINKMREQGLAHLVVGWGHHQQDFIETQFLRMIRGSGLESLAEPMKFWSRPNVRPFLDLELKEICQLSEYYQTEWVEDPSNNRNDYLRNWLRNEWLPQLDIKVPGSLRSVSRSLSLAFEGVRPDLGVTGRFPIEVMPSPGKVGEVVFSLIQFHHLAGHERREFLVQLLKSRGIKNFSQNQVVEIIKNLDKADKVHRFRVANCLWQVAENKVRLVVTDSAKKN